MKTRNSFVSNSSSTSFVLLFPNHFDSEMPLDMERLGKVIDEYYCGNGHPNIQQAEAYVRNGLMKLIHSSEHLIWESEYSYECDLIYGLFEEYVIAKFDTEPDNGRAMLADSGRIKRILLEK